MCFAGEAGAIGGHHAVVHVEGEHAAHISEVEAETVGTGVMGRMVSGVCFMKTISYSGLYSATDPIEGNE